MILLRCLIVWIVVGFLAGYWFCHRIRNVLVYYEWDKEEIKFAVKQIHIYLREMELVHCIECGVLFGPAWLIIIPMVETVALLRSLKGYQRYRQERYKQ